MEGWYGQPFDPPLGRTRDYVEIVRRVLLHRDPVEYRGRHLSLPLPGGSGLGRPFLSMVRPLRPDIPILLAAEGPRNVALAREIADGWIATYYSPYRDAHYRAALAEESAAAVPTAMIEQVALIGPAPKSRDELVEWRRSLLTTLLVHVTPDPAVLRQVAELVLGG